MSKKKISPKARVKEQRKVISPDEVISKIVEDTMILKGIASRFGNDKSDSKQE